MSTLAERRTILHHRLKQEAADEQQRMVSGDMFELPSEEAGKGRKEGKMARDNHSMTPKQEEEFRKWMNQNYPYDNAECGHCATLHYFACPLPEHKAMRREAKRLGFNGYTQRRLGPTIRKKILAFRKKFARFYPVQP